MNRTASANRAAHRVALTGSVALFLACSGADSGEPLPRDILKKADEARGNIGGVMWDVSVLAVEDGATNSRTLNVKARGFDISARILSPPKSKGQVLLMLDGNMWFYKPELSKPVPVSQRQKLIGRASNGDIASTNYAEDYDISSQTNDTVNGENCWLFDLRAKSKHTTYDRIVYWVSVPQGVGVKADYYTVSGKIQKSADMAYTNTVVLADGIARPFISKMTIMDRLTSEDTTTLSFSPPVVQPVLPYVFDLNLLGK